MHPDYFAGLDKTLQAFVACKQIPGWCPPSKEARFEAVCHIAATIYGIKVQDLKDPPDRRMIFVEARAMVYFYLRLCDYTYKEIGVRFKRDHASVIHNVKKMGQALSFKSSPERVGFIQLLYELGHIPLILINTVAGAQYLHGVFDQANYKEFFDLNLSYFDKLSEKARKQMVRSKIMGDYSHDMFQIETFHKRIKDRPLEGVYMRKANKTRVPC
jgi:hypothetical protein